MDVIILAGGLGTRIRSVTKNLPKVMIDLNGKPLLEHTFNYLKNFNVQNVILAVGYKKEYIKNNAIYCSICKIIRSPLIIFLFFLDCIFLICMLF